MREGMVTEGKTCRGIEVRLCARCLGGRSLSPFSLKRACDVPLARDYKPSLLFLRIIVFHQAIEAPVHTSVLVRFQSAAPARA